MAAPRRKPSAGTVRELNKAVHKELWERVIVLLRDNRFTYNKHNWAVRMAFKKAPEHRVGRFVPLCYHKHLDFNLKHLVKRDMWSVVGVMLDSGVSEGERQRAVHEASWRADEIQFIAYFLPHCAHDQLTSVLTSLLKRGFWKAILTLLERNVKKIKLFSVLAKAATDANDPSVVEGVITGCEGEQLISMLTHLLSEGVSEIAKKVLLGQHTRRLDGPAFERECGLAGEDGCISHLLPDHMVVSPLTRFVKQGMWGDAASFLKSKATKTQPDTELSLTEFAAPGSTQERINSALTFSVTERLWNIVDKVLNDVFHTTGHQWAINIYNKYAIAQYFIHHILQQCASDLSRIVPSQIVIHNLWKVVGMELLHICHDTQLRWVLEEASKHASAHDFYTYILPFCHADQMGLVRKHLSESGRLGMLFKDLLCKVIDERHRQCAIECSKCVTSKDFAQHVLPHCADDELDAVLLTLVNRDLWIAVDKVLHRVVSGERHTWAIEEGIQHATSQDLVQHLLPHCADYQRDSVLTRLVTQGLWDDVDYVLHKGVSGERHTWAIEEGIQHATSQDLVQHLLPHCADYQRDSVLTRLVTQGLWDDVDYVLHKGVSGERHRWAIEEGIQHATSQDLVQHLLPHCADYQRDSVLTRLVKQGLWDDVDYVLHKGVSGERHRWAVEKGSELATGLDFIQFCWPHCTDDQVDSVLTHLVGRRLWDTLNQILLQRFSGQMYRRNVEGSSKKASRSSCLKTLLLICTGAQSHLLLEDAVKERLWKVVGIILPLVVRDTRHIVWVFEKTIQHSQFYEYVLPQFSDDLMDKVLTHVLNKRLGNIVRTMLKNVCDKWRRWIIGKCSQSAASKDFIRVLPHCADDQLDYVLVNLVNRRLWIAVDKVLHRVVSGERHKWAIEEGIQHATSPDFVHLLPHCADDQLESVLTHCVSRKLWDVVDMVLQRGVSVDQQNWAIGEGKKHATLDDFVEYLAPHCSADMLKSVLAYLVKCRIWETVGKILHRGVSKRACKRSRHRTSAPVENMSFRRWMMPIDYPAVLPFLAEYDEQRNLLEIVLHDNFTKAFGSWVKNETNVTSDYEKALFTLIENCRVDALCARRLFTTLRRDLVSKVREIAKQLDLNLTLCELLYTSFTEEVCALLCSETRDSRRKMEPNDSRFCVRNIYSMIIKCIQEGSAKSVRDIIADLKKTHSGMTKTYLQLNECCEHPIHSLLRFLQQFHLYYAQRKGEHEDTLLLPIFAQMPLFPELQSKALRLMLRHKKWNVISLASLSHLWEEDRRQLLKAAVKQRQWRVVKEWADHTLYDDQRVWVINEALNEKQWEVALLFADHGLTETELMRVHYRLAKHAVWDVVLRMFERGGDVAEVKERLWRMRERKRQIGDLADDILNKYKLAVKLEEQIRTKGPVDYQKACQQHDWTSVLYFLIRTPNTSRTPSTSSVRLTLTAAIKAKAWHVVIQLVRVGIDANHRDSLFLKMMRRQQWGVCRVLLEQRLSVKVCLKALPGLMEMNQWILVARVLEYGVDDAVRQQIMERAWERREGSIVWLCIRSSPTILSTTEREKLFQRAFSCQLWQIIKPLVEFKDGTGFEQRETTLLAAIEQHQWDMVDHCQLHHADINIKDEKGVTPLQRAAQQNDWETVEELIVRDGDPNLLDSQGEGVLHRAIQAKQWGTVKLMIEYQANIHMLAHGATPLSLLIDHRKGELIEHSLMWCPGQAATETTFGQTALHAACVSGCSNSLYYLVARGVNPLAVTNMGQSVLVYAVMSKECPQRTVAECIQLGLSTHQPKLTGMLSDLVPALVDFSRWQTDIPYQIKSPIICSVLRDLPKVTQMLYDSGTCLYTELFTLYMQLTTTADPNSKAGTYLLHKLGDNQKEYNRLKVGIEGALPKLKEMATTPRSLVSTCRLVISHCLTLSKNRHSDIVQLPILSPMLKNYLMFTDLADPQYPYLSIA